MIRFIIRRLVYLVIVLLIITLVTYVIFFAGNAQTTWRPGSPAAPRRPGDPATLRSASGSSTASGMQYWHYLVGLLHGSFGLDFQNQVPINSEIARALPGDGVARHRRGDPLAADRDPDRDHVGGPPADRSGTGSGTMFALTFLSMPTFVLGVLFLLVFYFYLTQAGIHWFPAAGYVPSPSHRSSGPCT